MMVDAYVAMSHAREVTLIDDVPFLRRTADPWAVKPCSRDLMVQ